MLYVCLSLVVPETKASVMLSYPMIISVNSDHLLYQNWGTGLLGWVIACNNKHVSTPPSNEGQVKCDSCFDEELTLEECD